MKLEYLISQLFVIPHKFEGERWKGENDKPHPNTI